MVLYESIYCCGNCGDEWEWSSAAESCCAPEPEQAWRCTGCSMVHFDENDARECCPKPNEHENDCAD